MAMMTACRYSGDITAANTWDASCAAGVDFNFAVLGQRNRIPAIQC